MKTFDSKRVMLALGGLLVGAILVILRQGFRASPTPGTAKNGNTIKILGASFGTNHTVTLGRWPMLDPVRRKLPVSTNVIGHVSAQMTKTSATEEYYVFFNGETPEGTLDRHMRPAQIIRDQHGCQFSVAPSIDGFTVGETEILGQRLEVFPRRQKSFEVVFADHQGADDEVTTHLSNPKPWRGIEWIPQAAPAIITNGNLQVTFLGWGGSAALPQPRFRVEQNGVEQVHWKNYVSWFEDVTGNRSQSPSLCRHEPAWRVHTRWGQTVDSELPPENSWILFDGEFPKAGSAIALQDARPVNSVSVQLVAVGGPCTYRLKSSSSGPWQLISTTNIPPGFDGSTVRSSIRNGIKWIEVESSDYWLAMTMDGLGPDHHWQVVTVDESGRHTVHEGWKSMDNNLYRVDLGKTPTPHRHQLKLVIQRLTDFNFLVAPPKPQ
jgi:hypothetical protein